jgi:hypothetical protein
MELPLRSDTLLIAQNCGGEPDAALDRNFESAERPYS